jgi:hypothetical protein
MTASDSELHQIASLGRPVVSMANQINSLVAAILSNLLGDPEPSSLKRAGRILATCQNLNEIDSIARERIGGIIRGIKSLCTLTRASGVRWI